MLCILLSWKWANQTFKLYQPQRLKFAPKYFYYNIIISPIVDDSISLTQKMKLKTKRAYLTHISQLLRAAMFLLLTNYLGKKCLLIICFFTPDSVRSRWWILCTCLFGCSRLCSVSSVSWGAQHAHAQSTNVDLFLFVDGLKNSLEQNEEKVKNNKNK